MGYANNVTVEDTGHDVPKFGHQVTSIEELNSCKESIVHFAVSSSDKYLHHYLALNPKTFKQTGSFQIAHYTGSLLQMSTGPSCGKIEKDVKKMSDIVKDVIKGLYIIKNPAYPSKSHEYKEAHIRLEQRLGETDYRIASNNCEHFASYVMTGRPNCEQNNKAGHLKKVRSDTVDMLLCDGKSNALKTSAYLLGLAPINLFVKQAVYKLVTFAAKEAVKTGKQTVSCITKNMIKYAAKATESTKEGVKNLTEKMMASEGCCSVAKSATLKASLKAAGVTAAFTLVVECVFAAFDIYRLKQRKKKNQITDEDYKRELCKIITIVPVATTCTVIGTVLGQILCPIPVLGAIVGGFLGNIVGRWLGSILSGFLYDICN